MYFFLAYEVTTLKVTIEFPVIFLLFGWRRAVSLRRTTSGIRAHETSRCNTSTTLFVQGPAMSGIIKVLIGVDRPTRLRSTWYGSFCLCFYLVLTSISLNERPRFLYYIMGGSFKISFSDGCCCIKCHFLVTISLRF